MVSYVTVQYVSMAAGSVMESMTVETTVMRITAKVNYICKAHAWLQISGFDMKDFNLDVIYE